MIRARGGYKRHVSDVSAQRRDAPPLSYTCKWTLTLATLFYEAHYEFGLVQSLFRSIFTWDVCIRCIYVNSGAITRKFCGNVSSRSSVQYLIARTLNQRLRLVPGSNNGSVAMLLKKSVFVSVLYPYLWEAQLAVVHVRKISGRVTLVSINFFWKLILTWLLFY